MEEEWRNIISDASSNLSRPVLDDLSVDWPCSVEVIESKIDIFMRIHHR